MTNLAYSVAESGLEVVIAPSGAAYCTQSSYSRWTKVARQTIVDRCQKLETLDMTALQEPAGKSAGLIKTTINAGLTGNKEVVLVPAKIMARWLAKDNPDLFDEVTEAGATQFLYAMAGYQVKAVEPEPVAIVLPQNYKEALIALLHEVEERERLEKENAELMQEVEDLSEIVDELFDYSSIIRVAKFNGINEKAFGWRSLVQASTKQGLEVKKAPCPRYGSKNLYHHDAWRIAYPDVKLPECSTIVKIN